MEGTSNEVDVKIVADSIGIGLRRIKQKAVISVSEVNVVFLRHARAHGISSSMRLIGCPLGDLCQRVAKACFRVHAVELGYLDDGLQWMLGATSRNECAWRKGSEKYDACRT
jgi:hypothetical protein